MANAAALASGEGIPSFPKVTTNNMANAAALASGERQTKSLLGSNSSPQVAGGTKKRIKYTKKFMKGGLKKINKYTKHRHLIGGRIRASITEFKTRRKY